MLEEGAVPIDPEAIVQPPVAVGYARPALLNVANSEHLPAKTAPLTNVIDKSIQDPPFRVTAPFDKARPSRTECSPRVRVDADIMFPTMRLFTPIVASNATHHQILSD
jgi:hypothetical protein